LTCNAATYRFRDMAILCQKTDPLSIFWSPVWRSLKISPPKWEKTCPDDRSTIIHVDRSHLRRDICRRTEKNINTTTDIPYHTPNVRQKRAHTWNDNCEEMEPPAAKAFHRYNPDLGAEISPH